MNSTLLVAMEALDLTLTQRQLAQLAQFRDLLAASANEFNLTAIRDVEGIERRHIVESVAFGVFLQKHDLLPKGSDAAASDEQATESIRVVDIGTGAGLPGIPLRIAWPHMRLTLLESVGKKCRFMEEACSALGLGDVQVVEGRAEDFGRDEAHRERYDLALARAVAPLPVLLEYTLPTLKLNGWLAAPKGSAAISELNASTAALEALGGRLHDAAPFLPPDGLQQTVALIQKVGHTPERYPRRAGIPSKRPL